jgi:hypothetical protein
LVTTQPYSVAALLNFGKRFLNGLKPDTIGDRTDWLRFVVVRAEPANVRTMMPRLAPARFSFSTLLQLTGAISSWHSQRLYRVVGEQCAIRYVAVAASRVILCLHNFEWPVELVEIGVDKSFAAYIVGRVCHVTVACDDNAAGIHDSFAPRYWMRRCPQRSFAMIPLHRDKPVR